jgi:hypothetical protein
VGATVGTAVCEVVGAKVEETVGTEVMFGGSKTDGAFVGCDIGTGVGTDVNNEQDKGQVLRFVNVSTGKES